MFSFELVGEHDAVGVEDRERRVGKYLCLHFLIA